MNHMLIAPLGRSALYQCEPGSLETYVSGERYCGLPFAFGEPDPDFRADNQTRCYISRTFLCTPTTKQIITSHVKPCHRLIFERKLAGSIVYELNTTEEAA